MNLTKTVLFSLNIISQFNQSELNAIIGEGRLYANKIKSLLKSSDEIMMGQLNLDTHSSLKDGKLYSRNK